jgi:hypothetical protein
LLLATGRSEVIAFELLNEETFEGSKTAHILEAARQNSTQMDPNIEN